MRFSFTVSSTIAKLLLKFWPVQDGAIKIGGTNINNLSPLSVRSHMSYVSQGDFIVDETVKENLIWGYQNEEIDDQMLLEIIQKVGVESPQYENVLEAPAKRFSLGQQQRLSVARMMLDKSEIVIMDEPLAGVDVFTVRDLMPIIEQLLRNAKNTVLMISHRLSFASFADNIVIMDAKGKVVERGKPKDLLEARGIFYELYNASINEFDLHE